MRLNRSGRLKSSYMKYGDEYNAIMMVDAMEEKGHTWIVPHCQFLFKASVNWKSNLGP